MAKADSTPLHKLITSLVTRVAFFFYWIFDNLLIMNKLKVFQRTDLKTIQYRWAICWTIANFSSIIGAIIELVQITKKEAKLMAQKVILQSDSQPEGKSSKVSQMDDIRQQQADLGQQRFDQTLVLIKTLGDSITSTQSLGWPKHYLGYEFNDGLVGIGGFTSACITCYQLYPAKKSK